MKAFLILEDGTVFEGTHIGADKEIISEIVFNTSMAGYLEVLTDPSYAGQAVCMTYPLIGNYGICRDDCESERPWPDGFIVRELSRIPSNFRCDCTIQEYLEENGVPGIAGIDTRALTKILRNQGSMNGMITCAEHFNMDEVQEKLKAYRVSGTVERVTTREPQHFPVENAKYKIALMDFGEKRNMTLCLNARGCDVTVLPAHTPASEVLSGGYDGVMLSNGPGDPADNVEIIAEVKKLYEADLPVFAVCLGHQLMALATGAKTGPLAYGHRGANHPVRDIAAGRVFITSQNHGYMVLSDTVDPAVAEVSHVNVNDNTCEGLRYKGKRIFTVQFHPEASPGPQDTEYLFDKFLEMVDEAKKDGAQNA